MQFLFTRPSRQTHRFKKTPIGFHAIHDQLFDPMDLKPLLRPCIPQTDSPYPSRTLSQNTTHTWHNRRMAGGWIFFSSPPYIKPR